MEGKKFASMDEKYLGVAEKLLYSEMAYALDKEWDEIQEQITETLSRIPIETE
jgi:CarD family transcriptional regulator